MSALRALLRNRTAASAAEFALVLPLLLLFLLGLIDAGRFMWEYNQAEKATQMGVRYAVATSPVAPGLASYSFAASGGVPQGEPVPTSSAGGAGWFANASCGSGGCSSCNGSSGFCSGLGFDATAFQNVVTRMQRMYPMIQPANVRIDYRNVGLGYSGDPSGPDVAPLVTVRLTGLNFQPLTTLMFGGVIGMPDFRASLTLEDGSGTVAN